MIVLRFLIGGVALLIGLRMIGAAIYTFFSGKVLVRHGVKTKWVAAPPDTDFLVLLFRDGLMGILLVVLGVALLT